MLFKSIKTYYIKIYIDFSQHSTNKKYKLNKILNFFK